LSLCARRFQKLLPTVAAAACLSRSNGQLSESQMTSAGNSLAALVQLHCTNNKARNFAQARGHILSAASAGAGIVFLPECTDYVAESVAESIRMAEPIDGPTCSDYRALARETGLWLSIGSLHLRDQPAADEQPNGATQGAERISNSHLLIDPEGRIAGRYDKAHMFDVQVPGDGGGNPGGGRSFLESRYTKPGDSLAPVIDTPVGRVGLAICYDMRFAELAIGMRERGAQIITYPSAFTVPTGQAHWSALLRARAIETQCWLVAAAQAGSHNPRRHSYGHACIIDPWGKVCAELDDKSDGLALCQINLKYLEQVRAGMPVMQQRRLDLYPSVSGQLHLLPIPDSAEFAFGPHRLPASEQVFCLTSLSFAAVNLRPIRPHHTLVCPRRSVAMLSELTPLERADLFGLAELVAFRLRQLAGTESCSFSLQDGPLAGQSVPHVHIHVLPRLPGDFQPNDSVYTALEAEPKPERPNRSAEEMAKETAQFRALFYHQDTNNTTGRVVE
ncbi:hypothetical protein BOX15_Mlig027646g3, partial [Macrostomum lignano]